MRLLSGFTLVALGLLLAGCKLPERLRGSSGSSSTASTKAQPFMGSPASGGDPAPAPSGGPDTLASTRAGRGRGILAGSVLDTSSRRVSNAKIEVVELDGPRDKAAPLSYTTNKDGWFDIPGLEAGRWYRLVARVRDGSRVMTGSVRVQSPNVRVAIPLTGEEAVPPPAPPPSADASPKADGDKPATPAAAIGSPLRSPSEGVTTPLAGDDPRVPGAGGVPPPVRTVPDRTLIADQHRAPKRNDGYIHQPPTVNMDGPGRDGERRRQPTTPYAPPPNPADRDDADLTPSAAPSAIPVPAAPVTAAPVADEAQAPAEARLVVPSCVRIGKTVDDFALYDFDGNVWELKKKRRGKLVLLDFWFSSCGPCVAALPFMVSLDQKYRRFGLDVVGIAREEGTLVEKQDAVRAVKARNRIGYPLLFAGGGTGPCPVLRQLEVHQFPTLILLDESGKIVWRATGLDAQGKYHLEMEIRRRLGLR